jgi:hypothetical protein
LIEIKNAAGCLGKLPTAPVVILLPTVSTNGARLSAAIPRQSSACALGLHYSSKVEIIQLI